MASERFMQKHYGPSGYVSTLGASEEMPFYRKVAEDHGATPTFMIVCDEGWRESIVCSGMYGWAADWMLTVLGREPFAPKHRPGPTKGDRP